MRITFKIVSAYFGGRGTVAIYILGTLLVCNLYLFLIKYAFQREKETSQINVIRLKKIVTL